MDQPIKTRFDIKYNQTKGREVLIVECNYPERESGGRSLKRTFYKSRARTRFEKIQSLVNDDAAVERFIVHDLGVGGTGIFNPFGGLRGQSDMQPINAFAQVNEMFKQLGRMGDEL